MTETSKDLDQLLIDVLACPIDKGPLLWFADETCLYNPRLHKSYQVRDGIPIMLIDEATDVSAQEHERLTTKAAEQGVPETGHGPAKLASKQASKPAAEPASKQASKPAAEPASKPATTPPPGEDPASEGSG